MSIDKFRVNGVQVVNVKNHSDVASFGIATLAGSNYETPKIAGIAHFTEHMFFKGTENRTWEDITKGLSMLGVSPNAYTNNNEVYYHSTFPKENIEGVIDIMFDMFFNSTFPAEELEKERGVIIEEKKSYDDTPRHAFNEQVMDHFLKWDKGHTIIGEFETINSISRQDILDFLNDNINFSNLMFIYSGDIESSVLKGYIEKFMPKKHSFLKEGKQNGLPTETWKDIPKNNDLIKLKIERENISQSQAMMFMSGISAWDDDAEAVAVLLKSIGGGMYSELFTRIREELGLCYTVSLYGYSLDYPHVTGVDLYGGLATENVDLFIEESEKVLADVIKNGIKEDTFNCAKMDIISSTLRMTETSYGKAAYYLKKSLFGNFDREDSIDRVKKVTLADCNNAIDRIFNKDNEHKWCVMVPKDKS